MADDAEFRTGSVQNTLVAVWSGEPSAMRLASMVQSLRELHATNPNGVYLYNVISARTAMPEKAARDLMVRQFESMRGKLIAAAVVLEHSGIQYTLSRAIIATLATITRSPFLLKVFDSRATAAEWLSTTSKVPAQAMLYSARELEAAMQKAQPAQRAN
jgi:hypothetical protein